MNLTANLIATLIDRVTGPARGVTSAMERMQAAQMRNTRALAAARGQMMDAVAVGYTLVRSLSAPVMTAARFEAAMNRVGAVSNASAEELAFLSQQARELGRTTQFTATQAAEAQSFLAMAGFETSQIMGAMPGTLQLAAAAQLDLGRSADIVSNVLTGYRMEVDQLNRVNDVLVATFTSANTDLSQLGEAMEAVGPIAAAASVEFETTAAAVALLGNAGIQGESAGTALRNAFGRMLEPTTAMAAAMEEAGLSFTDAQGRLLPFADIIERLEPHADDAGLMLELFGLRAGPAMAALVGQGSDALRDLNGELLASGGTAQRVAEQQMQGFMGFLLRMKSALEGLSIAIGSALNPVLQAMGETLFPVIAALTAFTEAHPQAVAAVISLVAGVTALRVATIAARFAFLFFKGGLLSFGITATRGVAAIGSLTTGLRGMAVGATMLNAVGGAGLFSGLAAGLVPLAAGAAPFVAIAAAIAAVGLAVYNYWEPISNFVAGFASVIAEQLAPAIGRVRAFGTSLLGMLGIDPAMISAAFEEVTAVFSNFGEFLSSIFSINDYSEEQEAEFRNAGARLAQAIFDGMTGILDGLVGWVQGRLDAILGSVTSVASRVRSFFGGESSVTAAGTQDDFGGTAASSVLDGARATGGYVRAGSRYAVGEDAPEIFSTSRSGWITNQDQMAAARQPASSSVSVGDIHVHAAPGMSEEALADEVLRRLDERLSDAMSGIHVDSSFTPQIG